MDIVYKSVIRILVRPFFCKLSFQKDTTFNYSQNTLKYTANNIGQIRLVKTRHDT